MKAIKIIVILFIFLCFHKNVSAQLDRVYSIGDKIPEFSIRTFEKNKIINSKELLSSPLFIIDFWATWCVPCLDEMEFLDSLKNVYPNKFKVLMITSQDSLVIKDFFKKYPKYNTDNFDFITNDTLFKQSFPHRYIPHNIWVQSDGIIKNISDSKGVNEENIINFKSSIPLMVKADIMDFNIRERFDILNDKFQTRSIIGSYIKGLSGQAAGPSIYSRQAKIYTYVNGPISQILLQIFRPGPSNLNLLEVKTSDSLRIFSPHGINEHLLNKSKYKDRDDWKLENSYSYQLSLNNFIDIKQFKKYVYQDFERAFNLKIRETLKNREVIYAKFKQSDSIQLVKRNGDVMITFTSGIIKVRNANLQELLNYYSTYFTRLSNTTPYLVKSDDRVLNFDLNLRKYIQNHKVGDYREYFENALKDKGFTFKRDFRKIEVLEIIDLN